jgi:hypothetical protein
LTAFWVRDVQKDSGTQNAFTSYGLLIDSSPNRGGNFTPIASFSSQASYLGGSLQIANTADVYGAREVRANAVHANGGIATFVSSGGVMMYYTGGIGNLRSYSDAGGTADILAINPIGGRVIVGDSTGANAGAALDVVGTTQSTAFASGANQVVGAQQAAVANGVNAAAAPTQAEFNALVTQFNALLSRLRTHGLIAT